MTLPALLLPLLLGVVCASALGAAAHLLRGRTPRDLLTFWLAAQAGFWLGHLLASLLGLPLYAVGDLNIVAGLAGAVLAVAPQIVAPR